jgi:hypothetical protein
VRSVCPGCQRTFDEPGLCPFDRTRLIPISDAGTIVTGPPTTTAASPDGPPHSPRPPDPPPPVPAPSRRPVEIQVLTQPEGAKLYAGTTYRGTGGDHLSEPLGTRLDVTCKRTPRSASPSASSSASPASRIHSTTARIEPHDRCFIASNKCLMAMASEVRPTGPRCCAAVDAIAA